MIARHPYSLIAGVCMLVCLYTSLHVCMRACIRGTMLELMNAYAYACVCMHAFVSALA